MTAALTELDQLEKVTMRRVILRLVPFLMICYFFALLDRVNVGFRFAREIPIEIGSRFALREGGKTIGAGVVQEVD